MVLHLVILSRFFDYSFANITTFSEMQKEIIYFSSDRIMIAKKNEGPHVGEPSRIDEIKEYTSLKQNCHLSSVTNS
jgi:hypothetical protein